MKGVYKFVNQPTTLKWSTYLQQVSKYNGENQNKTNII